MISKALALFMLCLSLTSFAATAEKGKNFEAHFLDKMIMHHQDGVKMAELGAAKATNPEVKKMSEKMVSDQKEEIAQMEKWRSDLYKNVPKSKDMPPKMEMSSLQSASGKEFDKKYLDMMSKHHESGIDMFEEAESKATNDQIKKFAMKGSQNQEREKQHMEHMKTSM